MDHVPDNTMMGQTFGDVLSTFGSISLGRAEQCYSCPFNMRVGDVTKMLVGNAHKSCSCQARAGVYDFEQKYVTINYKAFHQSQ